MRQSSRRSRFDCAQLSWKVGQSSPKWIKVQSTLPRLQTHETNAVGALWVQLRLPEVSRPHEIHPCPKMPSPQKSGRVRSRHHRTHATILAAVQVRRRATFLESRPKLSKMDQSAVGPPLTPSLQTRPESVQESSSCDPRSCSTVLIRPLRKNAKSTKKWAWSPRAYFPHNLQTLISPRQLGLPELFSACCWPSATLTIWLKMKKIYSGD
jgi:hypothetical protein